jgi:MFS superfamily sulfate permease-like transporter
MFKKELINSCYIKMYLIVVHDVIVITIIVVIIIYFQAFTVAIIIGISVVILIHFVKRTKLHNQLQQISKPTSVSAIK